MGKPLEWTASGPCALPDFCRPDEEIILDVGLWRGDDPVANLLQLTIVPVREGENDLILTGKATDYSLRARSRNQFQLHLNLRHLRSTHCNICCPYLLDSHRMSDRIFPCSLPYSYLSLWRCPHHNCSLSISQSQNHWSVQLNWMLFPVNNDHKVCSWYGQHTGLYAFRGTRHQICSH